MTCTTKLPLIPYELLTLEAANIPYTKPSTPLHNIIDKICETIATVKKKPEQNNWDDYWSTHKTPQQPTYLYRDQIFRYKGRYIQASQDAESKFFMFIKEKCLKVLMKDITTIAEFGCGAGGNLLQVKNLYPNVKLYGFDWSESAVNLVSGFANTQLFNMLEPRSLDHGDNLGIITCGALEQLGNNFHTFLDYLPTLNAKFYLHIEPIVEFYDEESIFDAIAIAYHKKRGYLGEFYTEVQKRHKIIYTYRTGFGNETNEGYMILVWER